MADDLNAPLGQDKQKRLPKLPVSAPQLLAGALGLSGRRRGGVGGFRSVAPTSVAARDGDKDGKQHARHDGIASSPPDALAAGATSVETPPAGSRTVTIIDGSSGTRKLVTIPGNPDAASKALFDPKLVEATRHGAIPKIGPDGTRSSTRYAQPRQLPPDKKDSPQIAIIVGGLGISASGTADAFAKLPATVTFALTPYGVDLEKLAERARGPARGSAPGSDGAFRLSRQ